MTGSARRGLVAIVIATAIAGVAGYLVTWVVFQAIGPARYATFAVFWSAIYLVVGALSGIQQEITRATRPREPGGPEEPPLARNFAVVGAVVTAAVVLAATPVWALGVFPGSGIAFVAPLAVGSAAYVVVAVTAGVLYGLSFWGAVAFMVITDAVLRLVAIGGVLLFTHDPAALAWAVALPFPVSLLIIWFSVRSRVVGRSRLDVGIGPLMRNVAPTIVAAASTGVLVSGFPVILKLTSPAQDASILGIVILAVTLVRAPLIVTAMSLQSYLIVRLRPAARFARRVATMLVAVAGIGTIVSALGWALGPAVFIALFGPQAVVPAWLIAALVGSSTAVAALFVTGPALLSRNGHLPYSIGWVVAATVTVLALLVPAPFLVRTVLALVAGPAAGLIVHVGGLIAVARRTRRRIHVDP